MSGFSLGFMKPAFIAYGPSTMNEFPQLGLDAEEKFAPMHISVDVVSTVFKVGGPIGVVNGWSVQIVRETTEAVAHSDIVTVARLTVFVQTVVHSHAEIGGMHLVVQAGALSGII